MGSIRSLCNRGVLLENGLVKADGEVNSICDMYLNDSLDSLGAIWTKDIDVDKDFIVTRVELQDSNRKVKSQFSCNDDWHIQITVQLKKRIPGLYGYLKFTKADGVAAWVSDSNDIVLNKLEMLPIGESKIDILIPRRTLGAGSYSIYLNFTSNHNITGFNVDSPLDVCVCTLSDDYTERGDARGGYLSTLLDWKFI